MLHYVVRRYSTLQDVTLRCKTLHYVVRRYTTLLISRRKLETENIHF